MNFVTENSGKREVTKESKNEKKEQLRRTVPLLLNSLKFILSVSLPLPLYYPDQPVSLMLTESAQA